MKGVEGEVPLCVRWFPEDRCEQSFSIPGHQDVEEGQFASTLLFHGKLDAGVLVG